MIVIQQNYFELVQKYANKGILEANIDYVTQHDSFVCVAKIQIDINLNDAYSFKNLIAYLHEKCDFGAILIQKDSVLLLFRDCKIHQAKTYLQKIQSDVKLMFNISLHTASITLIDIDDDVNTLLNRLEEYFIMSKISTNKKIFYGTKDFNFYEGEDNFHILKTLFKKLNAIKIHNLYEGIPVVDRVGIINFNNNILTIKVQNNKIPFYKHEEFCFLEHDLVPNIIKADILRVNDTQNILSLHNLSLQDTSPVQRCGIRVQPKNTLFGAVLHENKDICRGYIVSISENSILLKLNDLQKTKLALNVMPYSYLTFKAQIPTAKNFITNIKAKATIFRIDKDEVVINIYPNAVAKTKIRAYIQILQTALLLELKTKLKAYM